MRLLTAKQPAPLLFDGALRGSWKKKIRLGGFSGLALDTSKPSSEDGLSAWTITDRGPNLDPVFVGQSKLQNRPFAIPSFTPSIVGLKVFPKLGHYEVNEILPLRSASNRPLTGLPPLMGHERKTDAEVEFEVPVDTHSNRLDVDPDGIDPESIAVDDHAHFWVSEEYGPSIMKFSPEGGLLKRWTPRGAGLGGSTEETLPEDYKFRKLNRGFESLALEGSSVFVLIQSPLAVPSKRKLAAPSRVLRLLEVNRDTGQPVGEYLYNFQSEHGDRTGDLVALGSRKFLLIEQNSERGPQSIHHIYKIDLSEATNVLGRRPSLVDERSWENLSESELRSEKIAFAKAELVADLVALGWIQSDKIEGITVVNRNTLLLVNDDDFGLSSNASLEDISETFVGWLELPK